MHYGNSAYKYCNKSKIEYYDEYFISTKLRWNNKSYTILFYLLCENKTKCFDFMEKNVEFNRECNFVNLNSDLIKSINIQINRIKKSIEKCKKELKEKSYDIRNRIYSLFDPDCNCWHDAKVIDCGGFSIYIPCNHSKNKECYLGDINKWISEYLETRKDDVKILERRLEILKGKVNI